MVRRPGGRPPTCWRPPTCFRLTPPVRRLTSSAAAIAQFSRPQARWQGQSDDAHRTGRAYVFTPSRTTTEQRRHTWCRTRAPRPSPATEARTAVRQTEPAGDRRRAGGGDESAAGRAMHDLAHQLLNAAERDIQGMAVPRHSSPRTAERLV
ncbi:dsRBD fold-containing protein [Streptomyces sp. NPDC001292]|uniref:dsRBD fold-containing protein n=1 Tax=Streptomyces sp. NPDC001292 TaxID=3364558 RepID=UPI0036957F24